jgi:hypothetical protein
MRRNVIAGVVVVAIATSFEARADEPQPKGDAHEREEKKLQQGASSPARSDAEAASEPPKKEDESDPDKTFKVGGYIETYYAYSLARPGNGIIEGRGGDARHNTFALQNAVVDVGFHAHNLLGRLALQTGTWPSSYYGQEPAMPGTQSTGGSDPGLWRYLQRAAVGWQVDERLLLEAGLFLTSFGFESIAVKDNWTWSRSNVAVRLPNYMTGVRATVHVTGRLDVITGIVNGWNRVIDDNDEKTVHMSAVYRFEKKLTGSLTYYGGVERPPGAPEGRAWRHSGEGFFQLDVTDWLSGAAHAATGFEHTRFGAARYAGGALVARLKPLEKLAFAGRVDALLEDRAGSSLGTSSPMLMDAGRIVSETGTVDYRPIKGFSVRGEYRHDQADDDLYFRSHVAGSGTDKDPYQPSSKRQDTVLLGLVGWF